MEKIFAVLKEQAGAIALRGQTRTRIVCRKLILTVRRFSPKSLMVRYTVALVMIAALISVEQIIVQMTLRRQTESQHLIHLMDRQQIEISRLTRAALTTQLASRDSEVFTQLQTLVESSIEAQRGHEELESMLASEKNWLGHSLVEPSKQLNAAFLKMNLDQQSRWKKVLKGPLSPSTRYALRASLQQVRTGMMSYRQELNDLFSQLDMIKQAQVHTARLVEFFIFALLLGVLFLEGFFIFRPSIRGLESSLRARLEFMSRVSHEIRNPMNAIMGMTDVLRETSLTDLQRRYLDTLGKSSHSLLELLNSLLDFSALESGKTTVEKIPFELLKVLESAIDVTALRAHEKKLALVLDVDPQVPLWVTGDPVRLNQVVSNLLSNAIKFTEKGEVRLSVRPELRGTAEQYLFFSVADTGIGISPKSLSRVFESFVQADASTRRKYGGTGLGLTISKELVQLMGGNLAVKSELGLGSEFWFSIPVGSPLGTGETLESRLKTYNFSNVKALCLGPVTGALEQAAALIRFCGGRVESRFEDLDYQSNESLIVLSLGDEDSLLKFFPDDLPPQAHIACILRTIVSPAQMRSLINFGVSEFVLEPMKPLDFIQTMARMMGPNPFQNNVAVSPMQTTEPSLRILVADDSAENRELIRLYLAQDGGATDSAFHGEFELEFAVEGADAIRKFKESKYDVVLMDIQMPVTDGREAFTAIRQWERTQSRQPVPIIAITADDRAKERSSLLDQGFTDVLTKPLRKADLISHLRSTQTNLAPPSNPKDIFTNA